MYLISDKITILIKKVDIQKESGIAILYLTEYDIEIRGWTVKKADPGKWFVSPPSVYLPDKKAWFWQVRIHNRTHWDVLHRAIIKLFLKKLEGEKAAAAARATQL